MNTGLTLVDVRQAAMDAVKDIKAGKMDIKQAQMIKGLLDTVVDTAKTQVAFLQAIPNKVKESLTTDEVKAMAGTLQDRDADMDITMKQIEDSRSKNPLNR